MATFKRILAATDSSEASRDALDLARSLAHESSADLIVTHTCEVPAYNDFAAPIDLITPLAELAQSKPDDLLPSIRAECPDAKGVGRALGADPGRSRRGSSRPHRDGDPWPPRDRTRDHGERRGTRRPPLRHPRTDGPISPRRVTADPRALEVLVVSLDIDLPPSSPSDNRDARTRRTARRCG